MKNTMHSHPLDGVFTALVTPFTASAEIDWRALDRLLDQQLAAGVAGLVPVGTTGEAATLSADEALAVIAHVVRRAGDQVYVLAGAGHNVTTKTTEATRRAVDVGADGVLLVTPYYNKPSQRGLLAHYAAVAEACSADIVLYSVPGRTGVSIEAPTAAELARSYPHVVGIKEAGGQVQRVTELRAACGTGFVVHCGDDALALPFYAVGARGLTSVLANVEPKACVALHQAWVRGDSAKALLLHEALAPLAHALFIESNPSPVKRALCLDGGMQDTVRLPMVPVSGATDERLRQAMTECRSALLALLG